MGISSLGQYPLPELTKVLRKHQLVIYYNKNLKSNNYFYFNVLFLCAVIKMHIVNDNAAYEDFYRVNVFKYFVKCLKIHV